LALDSGAQAAVPFAREKELSRSEEGRHKKKSEKEDEEGEDASRERKLERDVSALHALVVARLSRGFSRSSQQDCLDAAEWLGLDLEPSALLAEDAASLGKRWPRMLRHLATAIGEGTLVGDRFAELWELGPRLFDEAVLCAETPKLQAALETRSIRPSGDWL